VWTTWFIDGDINFIGIFFDYSLLIIYIVTVSMFFVDTFKMMYYEGLFVRYR
jgi:hypothetical protein